MWQRSIAGYRCVILIKHNKKDGCMHGHNKVSMTDLTASCDVSLKLPGTKGIEMEIQEPFKRLKGEAHDGDVAVCLSDTLGDTFPFINVF